MIRLERVREKSVISEKFRGGEREKLNLKLMEARRNYLKSGEKRKPTKIWKVAKKQLSKESSGKCAYCEASFITVSYGDVEHYRPQSKYWWLVYCYDNYLVSCQLCNQKYKNDKFPTQNSRLKSPVRITRNSTDRFLQSKKPDLTPDPLDKSQVADFESEHRTERPFIINPYTDDPSQWFAWEADDNTQQVTLVALKRKPNAKRYVKAANDCLGLNRIELQNDRYVQFDLFRTFKDMSNNPSLGNETRARVKKQIRNMTAGCSRYAGMLRFFDQHL